ncbi:MAG: hypothetical protein FWE34_08790, partial [Defluviitaleaceae bacterium]|nr:hypothetical protein [Defluviitaleaceae bacterium]
AWDGEEKILSSGSVAITYLSPGSRWGNPYSDLIFVHTKAESLNFPDDIIVAWPRTIEDTGEIDARFYEALIDGIHWMANRTKEDLTRTDIWGEGQLTRQVVTLEEFGLTYPLTMEDLIYNWEKVDALWFTFESLERTRILSAANRGEWPESPPWLN